MADTGYYDVNGKWVPGVKGAAHDAGGEVAIAKSQEDARVKATAKDAVVGRPIPPDTTGMGLVQASAANAGYKKKLAAWESSRTAGAQAKAIEK